MHQVEGRHAMLSARPFQCLGLVGLLGGLLHSLCNNKCVLHAPPLEAELADQRSKLVCLALRPMLRA
eukprot:12880679-Prorocentrum_lima.AAC.1